MNPYPIFSVRSHMCVYARVHTWICAYMRRRREGKKDFRKIFRKIEKGIQ